MKPKRYFVGEDHDQPDRDNQGRAHHVVRDHIDERPIKEINQARKRRITKKSKKGRS